MHPGHPREVPVGGILRFDLVYNLDGKTFHTQTFECACGHTWTSIVQLWN